MATTNCLLACHQNTKELRQVENIFVKKRTSEERELELDRVVVICSKAAVTTDEPK
jgi:hypothetical protein